VSPRRLVLVDTNVLLNLAFVDRLDLLGALPDLEFRSPPEVFAEILGEQEKALVEVAVRSGHLQEITFSEVSELALFAELTRSLGMGEAACLALAVHHGAFVASDEKRAFLREAEARLGPGRILNTPGLLLLAIRKGLLTVQTADEMKLTLESKRFRMKFSSFGDLL
jgi:predicted nucleic acid-binding protein